MSRLNEQLTQKLPLAIALGAAVVYFGFVMFSEIGALAQVDNAGSADSTHKPSVADSNESAEQRMVDITRVADMHIFGRYAPPADKSVEKPVEPEPVLDLSALPKTKINLKLSGIGYTSNDVRAYAIIVKPDGQHDHFVIGEEIIPNATVHLIERERVIIKHNGKLEVLELPDSNVGNPNLSNREQRVARRNDARNNNAQANR